jgi:hypothetical protein
MGYPFTKKNKPITKVYCTRHVQREINNNNTYFIKNTQNYLAYSDRLDLNDSNNFNSTKFEIERVEDINFNRYSELDNKSDFIYSGDTVFIKQGKYYLSKGTDGKYKFTEDKNLATKFIIEQD